MLKINFEANEELLARYMISQNYMPTSFANYLWDKYRVSYKKFKRNINDREIDSRIIKELEEQDFFKKDLQSAKNNCVRISQNWDENQEKIQVYLNSVLKLDLDLEVVGFVMPPNFNTGENIGNNCFIWGHNKGLKDENYDLVYVVHESLHSYFDKDDMSHAIIENICDVELSRFLNHTIEHYPYHSSTQDEHIKIYPYWNLYINKSKEEIKKDQQYTNIVYDIDKYEKHRNHVSKLNINEFVAFLREKINKNHAEKAKE